MMKVQQFYQRKKLKNVLAKKFPVVTSIAAV